MLTKIVELGCVVPGTLEPRVTLLDDSSVVKTASNALIDYWDGLTPSPDYAYAHVLAMSAVEFYGPNNNGDAFYEADLKAEHPKFVTDANVFLHHINKDPLGAIGKPVFSFYNDEMHRAELILRISKSDPKAAKIIEGLKNNEQLYVSMGVKVPFDVCSICGNKSKTRADYCDHLKYNMKAVLQNGDKVFAYNPSPLNFFDISFVHRPADKIAFVLNKIAGADGHMDPNSYSKRSSAELGDAHDAVASSGEGLRKFADIVKYVDGQVVNSKDLPDPDAFGHVRSAVKDNALKWPIMPKAELASAGVTSPVFASSMLRSGGPWSFSDIDLLLPRMRPLATHSPSTVLRAVGMMESNPLTVDDIIASIFKALLGGGYAIPKAPACRCSEIISPVLRQRRSIMVKMGAEAQEEPSIVGSLISNMAQRSLTGLGPAYNDELTVVAPDSTKLKANRASRMIAEDARSAGHIAQTSMAGLLALAALGAALSGKGIERIAAPIGLGGLAYLAMPNTQDDGANIMTEEGVRVPSSTAFRAVGKAASDTTRLRPTPAYLALDYLFSVTS